MFYTNVSIETVFFACYRVEFEPIVLLYPFSVSLRTQSRT